MAKKDDFDDLDFDDMEWDDFSDPPRQDTKSRNPILNVAKSMGRSALATVWPKGKRDQVILKGMPKPASEAYDGYQNAAGVAKDVYAHTKDEILKTERVIAQQARQLGPTMRKYLPNKLTDPIQKWARSKTDGGYQGSPYDAQQAGIDRMMGEVFGGGQADMSPEEQADARKEATEDRIRQAVSDMKSDALMNTVLGIARDVSTQTGLSKGVFLNVQRKQLELQYRTLFALQDIAKLKQSEFERNTPALEAIVKNTALPDYAKEEFSEIHWANIKRKAADWMNPLRYGEEFMNQVRDNLSKKITGAFGDIRSLLEMGGGSLTEDDFDMDDQSALSPEARKRNGQEKAAGWLTKLITKKLVGPQIEKLQGKTREWMEQRPEYMSKLHQAQFKMRGWTQGTISNSAIAGEEDGTAANVFRMGRDFGIINPMQRERAFLDQRDGEALNRVAKFDRRAHLALTEIIPAWLSEINKSIRRGYGEHADLEYDITTRGFTQRREIADRVRKHVANDSGRLKHQETIQEIVNYIDPKNTLTPKDRQHLADYLESRVALGRSMNVDSILKDSTHLMRYMPSAAADRVVSLLQEKATGMTGGNYELSNELEDRFRSARAQVNGYQKSIDEAAAIYGERALRDAGIFGVDKKTGQFGADKDLTDPFSLFNDTRMGKTRSGRALSLDQEIQKKLRNNSALADLLRQRYGGGFDDILGDNIGPSGGPGGPGGKGGKGGRGKGKGMTPYQLARVLYGETETNFVDLLKGVGQGAATTETDRIIEAIRANNLAGVTEINEKILAHVKSMDEQGVLLASLVGGEGGGGDDEPHGPPRPGGGPGRRRIVLGESGLFRRWGGLIADTAGGAFGLAKRGALGAKNRLGRFGSWMRGRFGGPSDGPGLFARARGLIQGGIGGAFNTVSAFGKGLLGVKDIYDERGRVVLQGKKLEAGEYYQVGKGQGSTPKQLLTLDDIRLGRDIVDEDGNVILTAAELAAAGKLRYYKGGKLQSLFQVIAGKAGGVANSMMKLPGKVLAKLRDPIRTAQEWLTGLPDIYVKGDANPRLYANLMRQGHYINTLTHQPVFKVSDISGPIDDINGNAVITQADLQNPEFALVDKWGREVKSPLGRIFSRLARTAGKARDLIMGIPGKLKHLATNNPLTRWWQNRGQGGGSNWFSGNSLFGGVSSSHKTNHILIRIYKLLNQRMAGEPEDEAWTEEMEKGVSGSKTLNRLRGQLKRRGRRTAARIRRRWRNKWAGRWDRAGSWLANKRNAAHAGMTDFGNRWDETADSFREAEHDMGTRYEVERRLLGRDDDTAAFYRDRLYRKGRFSKAKIRSAAMDDVEGLRDAAGNLINTGRRQAKSIGARVLDRLNKMVDLQEVGWLNTMRTSLEQSGASEGFLRGMYSKFARRVKFNAAGEKRDYFQFFRRQRPEHDDFVGPRRPGESKKKGGIMDMLKSLPLVGPLVSILSTVGSIVGTVAKWGLFKPAGLMAKGAWWLASGGAKMLGGAAMRGLIMPVASAAAGVVATLGWPVTLLVGAGVGLSIAAYRIATTTYTDYLDTMRLAQYGYRDYDKWSSDDGAKARYLEDQLKGFISFNGQGQATCRGLGGKEVEKLAAGYGLNTEDKSEMLAFQAHMLQRFIPVYLRWLTTLKGMDRDIQLADVGDAQKLSKAEMKAIYEKTALTKDAVQLRALEDPRKVNQGFMSKVWDTVTFTSPQFLDADEVMEVQEDTLRDINKRMEDNKNRKFKARAAGTEALAATGVQDAFGALQKLDTERNNNTVKTEGWEDGTEQVQIQIDHLGKLNQKDVDALESLRMKTYGLKNLDSGYVQMLKDMERYVLPDIDTKTGTYNGKWTSATDIIAPQVWQTPRGDRVHHWFVNRFLPTFMFYVCGFKRYDAAGDPLNVKLTGGYLYELGLLTSRAYNMRAGIRQTVWEVALVPWEEDGANTDPSSVEPELTTLKELSKQADLVIRGLLKEKTSDNRKIAQWQKKDKHTNFYSTTGNNDQTQTYTAEEQAQLKAARGYGGSGFTGVPNDLSQSVNAVGGLSNWAKYATGNSAVNLGELKPGDYKQLVEEFPLESLNNVENVKKMIATTADKMGIPPGLALGMAYAESKFNYTAKNPGATAAGLFQFINGTWNGMMSKYGNNYGIPGALMSKDGGPVGQYDPHANTLLGLQFIRDNIEAAQRDLGGKAPPPAVAYLYHFLGPGGGRQFLRAWMENPNAPATAAPCVTQKVLRGNYSVFYHKGGRLRTLDEVIQELNGRMGSVMANNVGANPSLTKSLTSGLTPQSSSPSVAAGAAPAVPSQANGAAGAAQNLPADNQGRRPEALATKGTMGADNVLAASGGTPVPGGGGVSGTSDVGQVGKTVEAQAKADGLSDDDAAKVRAAAEARAAQQTQSTPAAAPSDMSPSAGGYGTATVGMQTLMEVKSIRTLLTEMRDLMKSGSSLSSSAGGAPATATRAPRDSSYTQPSPTLNVSRQAS